MKKIISSAVCIALAITAVSCKSSKKNSSTNVVEEVKTVKLTDASEKTEPVEVTYADPVQQKAHEEQRKDETMATEQEKITSYVFSVSFFSIGTGSDGAAMNRFAEFLENYNKKEKVQLVYEKNRWGREGEVDYCFMLTELDSKQRTDFIAQTQKILSGSKLVHIAENAQCHPGKH